MNWDAIGAIGEILGALAVVVSLLYLAVQIRQNSRIVKGASVQAITQTMQSELRWSGDYSESFLRMIEEPDSLSKVEAFKIGEWATAAMLARQNEHIQYQQGLIDENVWRASRGVVKNILSMPWLNNWWVNFDKSTFTQEFIELVNSVTAEEQIFDYQEYLKSIHNDEESTKHI